MPRRGRENEGPLPDALAYFLTWATYGTWLPGDERGWVQHGQGWQLPDPIRKLEAEALMTEDACLLSQEHDIVEATISKHCRIRRWVLHAANCRTNHLHVVVTASTCHPDHVREQFKAWCTRRLKEHECHDLRRKPESPVRENWWAQRGSKRYLTDEVSLEAANIYVRDGQDRRE
jgi:hypothetical protein